MAEKNAEREREREKALQSGGFSIVQSLTASSGKPLGPNPPEEHHGAVMVDMEERDLTVLLPQDEEHSVQQLNNLGEVVPPHHSRHLQCDPGKTRRPEAIELQAHYHFGCSEVYIYIYILYISQVMISDVDTCKECVLYNVPVYI